MEVIIMKNREAATTLTAKLIAAKVKSKPSCVLGMATGRTMEEVYDMIVAMNLDFSSVTTFNLDEYIGLEGTNKNSYRYYMNENLFKKINIKLYNTYLPNGMAKNMKEECEKYERLISDHGGIDIQLLGLGKSGHIGFNEPLSSLFSRTREKALTQTTIDQNSGLFDKPQDMPKRALTMGVGTILEAKKILMLATGKDKAEILAKAVEGPITSMISATALQLHPSCTVICDEEAASDLKEKAYYRWIFQNEPEWQPYR
ncbi:MAG TPA: glucosamine-6-phosphate deaminase [Lentisphaeria bacterium]|nr:MAG: glucosamine-6-phosphate deaminase [Lentisphaerae bacterium GWF2_38_69]HBM15480.1 glucosamine-6-phosphate deaminase [Lentisphaeria bacterium]